MKIAPFPIPSRARGWTPPWAIIGPGATAVFFASYQTGAFADRLASFGTDGAEAWNIPEFQPWRLIPDDSGFITVSSYDTPRRYDAATGSVVWQYTPPEEFEDAWGFVQSNDAAPDGNGGAFVVLQHPDNDTSAVYHVNSSGAGTHLYTVDRIALGMSFALADSIELSSDGSVLFVLVLDLIDNGPVELLGVSASTGALLWREAILSAIDGGSANATIRRVPGGDTLIVALPGVTTPSNLGRVVVRRLDFASGVSAAPAVTWTTFATGSAEESQVTALAVASDGILVGYGKSAEGGGDAHIATKLDLDGDVLWRLSSPSYAATSPLVSRHSLAVAAGRVLAGVSGDWGQFASLGAGLVLVDWATGERVSAGVLPLELAAVIAVGGPVRADAPILIT